MNRFRLFSNVLALILLLLSSAATAKPSEPSMGNYLKANNGQLETSVVTLKNSTGQTVDLISAVHVGSTKYYKTLNDRFQHYDAVLYELILPDSMAGKPLPSQLETGSGLGGIQQMLAGSLGLVTQLQHIDYSAGNFVHADLTQSGLSKKMADRNEDLVSYLMKAMTSTGSGSQLNLGVTEQELSQLDLVSIMSGQAKPQDQKILRKLFSSVLSSSGGVLSGMEDSTLVAERNKQAIAVLKQQTASGKRSLAIFYGAAHMPDLERRLTKAGWEHVSIDWIRAW